MKPKQRCEYVAEPMVQVPVAIVAHLPYWTTEALRIVLILLWAEQQGGQAGYAVSSGEIAERSGLHPAAVRHHARLLSQAGLAEEVEGDAWRLPEPEAKPPT